MIHPAIAASVLAPLCAAGDGTWIGEAPLAVARQEHASARIEGTVYVLGGIVAGPGVTNSVETYDLATGTWSSVAPMPAALHHHGVAACDGKLYVAGGYTGAFVPRKELWIYDPAVDAWTQGADLPEVRGAPWAAEHGGRVYLFGGTDAVGAVRDSIYRYDPAADAWSEVAPMPTPREHLNAVSVGPYVYAIGGRNPSGPLTVNERYHPAGDTWTTMAPMVAGRSAMGMGAIGSRIYAAGGEIPILWSVHEVYDVATDAWSFDSAMPVPRHGLGAVPLDDRLLFPGGGVVQGLGPSAHVDAFRPDAVLTGSPPSLSLAAGGTHALDVRAGCGLGGEVYVVAGTTSGTSPGLAVGAMPIPLVPDPYFDLTLLGSPLLSGFAGVLDATGAGTASVALPAGSDPGLAGLEVHHAFAVLKATAPVLAFVSNAAPLALVP